MKNKKVFSILIALIVLQFSVLPSMIFGAEAKATFKDVTSKYWAYNAVNEMNQLKVINGDTAETFNPEGKLTNAEVVTLLVNITNLYNNKPTQAQTTLPYKDVSSKDWYYGNVLKAYNLGIIGQTDKFNPNDYVDRETTIYMMGKLLNVIYDSNNNSYLNLYTENKTLITPIYEAKNKTLFADESKIADANTVKQMTIAGIISGKQNSDPKGLPVFDPTGKLTRAEAATLLYRYYSFIETIPVKETPTIVDNGASFLINHKGYDLTVSVDMSTIANYSFVVDITDVKVNGDSITVVYKTSPATEYIFNSPVKANPKDSFTTKVKNQTYKYNFQKTN